MPNFYYIKSGGTATGTGGKYAVKKTGSWDTAFSSTSQYYNDIYTAVSQSAASAGDVLIVSNLHNYTNTVVNCVIDKNYSIEIYCVDDTNITTLTTGAVEIFSRPESYVDFQAAYYVYGMRFEFFGKLYLSSRYNNVLFENCYFKFIGSNSYSIKNHRLGTNIENANTTTTYFKCIFDFDSSINWRIPGYLYPNNSIHYFFGCVFKAFYNSYYSLFTNLEVDSGDYSCRIILECCDFSQALRSIFDSGTNLRQTYLPRKFVLKNCNYSEYSLDKLPTNGSSNVVAHTISNSDRIGFEDYGMMFFKYGRVNVDFNIYRNAGANIKFEFNKDLGVYEGFDNFSVKVQTYSTCSVLNRLGVRFKLVDFIRDFSSLTTLTLFIVQENINSSLLTNEELFLDITYPDDTSPKANCISNYLKPFDPITIYPLGGVEWIGFSSGCVRQKIVVSTTSLGKEGLCSIWLNVYAPNKIIYICPKVVLS